MEKDIAQGDLGKIGHYDIAFKGGKMRAEISADSGVGVKGGAFIEADSDSVIDALCKAIPGQIDDALGAILKAALKNS